MTSSKVMHAVQYDRYGGGASALKHVEVSIPSPKNDEILLKLEASSLNPVDWKIQTGVLRPFLPRKFPFFPGDGAEDYACSIRVVFNCGQLWTSAGK